MYECCFQLYTFLYICMNVKGVHLPRFCSSRRFSLNRWMSELISSGKYLLIRTSVHDRGSVYIHSVRKRSNIGLEMGLVLLIIWVCNAAERSSGSESCVGMHMY